MNPADAKYYPPQPQTLSTDFILKGAEIFLNQGFPGVFIVLFTYILFVSNNERIKNGLNIWKQLNVTIKQKFIADI